MISLKRFYFIALWAPIFLLVIAYTGSVLFNLSDLIDARNMQSNAFELFTLFGIPYSILATILSIVYIKRSAMEIRNSLFKFPLYGAAIFLLWFMFMWVHPFSAGKDDTADFPPMLSLLTSIFALVLLYVYILLVLTVQSVVCSKNKYTERNHP